jgi:hypothetical protein
MMSHFDGTIFPRAAQQASSSSRIEGLAGAECGYGRMNLLFCMISTMQVSLHQKESCKVC